MFAGVEGGTSSSKAVVVDEDGIVLGMAEGPHTNHWLLGLDETAKRIHSLLLAAISVSGLPSDTELLSIGLTLSGMDTEQNIEDMREAMEKVDEKMKGKVFVANDAVGALMTATDQGGIIVISGTGTVGMFVGPDGSYQRVGGMGHALGDEGSAFWITHYIIRTVMRHEMEMKLSSFDIFTARKAILQYFNVTDFVDLLPYFYTNFDKCFIAKLTVKFAEEAEKGDELCRHGFYKGGQHLGRLVAGALNRKNKTEFSDMFSDGRLKVVCGGCVWKSWRFLQPGFMASIRELSTSGHHITEISLMQLTVGASVGAACLGAKRCLNQAIHCDYSSNVSVFHHEYL